VVDNKFYPNPALQDDEREVLDEFREALEAIGAPLPDDEWTLVRFLRARGTEGARDVKLSVEMILKSMAWREEFGTDDILHTLDFPEREQVAELYPVGYFNTTNDGHPVYIERLGALDVPKLYTITTQERLLKYHVFTYEEMIQRKLPACTRAKGERVVQSFTILDLEGCSMSDLLDRQNHRFLGAITAVDQDNFPEMLYRMFIINAPAMFSMAWSIIKRFLDPKTRDKISILGSDRQAYLAAITEYVPLERLPTFIGGTHPAKDWPKVQPGPWQEWQPDIPMPTPMRTRGRSSSENIDFGQASAASASAHESPYFVSGRHAHSGLCAVGRSDSLVRLSYKRQKPAEVASSGEVRDGASEAFSRREAASASRDRAASAARDRGLSSTSAAPNDNKLKPEVCIENTWGAVYGLAIEVDPVAQGLSAWRERWADVTELLTWDRIARSCEVESIAGLLVEGVAPNYEGQVQVKLRGGLFPHWSELYVSLSGGVIVCREQEHSEDALAPASLLQAEGVRLARSNYVKVDGLIPSLELYHDDTDEAMLWFVSLQCSMLLALHAPTLAAMRREGQLEWWLQHLGQVEQLTKGGKADKSGGVMAKAGLAKTLSGLGRHFF